MSQNKQKTQRQRRVRAKVQGTVNQPRLSVYRSNRAIAGQIIDDSKQVTLLGMQQTVEMKGNKTEKAKALGVALAKAALSKKIKKVVFDKGSYRYHGRVKALAEGAREGGLEF